MADGQGVAQNTAAPVVDGQPVYSDIALADYMAKQAAQQKFGDAQQTPAGLQETMHAQDMSAQLDAIPEENVVASAQNNGTIDTESREDISTSFKGIKTLEEIRIELEHAGLTQIKIDEILKMPKGKRPDPSTYLSKDYITNHLSYFQNGVTKIKSTAPIDIEGVGLGTFVMPKVVADYVIKQAAGDVNKLERLLGLSSGDLGTNPVRVDIADPKNIRIPSGNEAGAWPGYWVSGGYTNPGGVMEAVIDPVPKNKYVVTENILGK